MKLILTCGGTAGHIYPAVAVAGRIRELFPDAEILFIGAEGKMEMQLVPREGYEIKALKVMNLSRKLNFKGLVHNVKSAANLVGSLIEAKRIIREFKPDAVIGTGGYVCYPVLKAASDLKIPTAVHESNAVPGLTTKMLAKKVDRVLVGFEESRAHYPNPDKVSVTGTPVRGEFARYTKSEAKAELGLDADKPLLVSVWGSLGAGYMNEIMTELIPMLGKQDEFSLIHSAGSFYYKGMCEQLSEKVEDLSACGVDLREYIYDMPRVMAAADLIMCRAGASTLAELSYMAKPVMIVPSPNVTNNHQEKNARVLEKAGGAKVFLEGEFTAESLLAEMKSILFDSKKLSEMSAAMGSLAVPEATDRICDIILGLIG